MSIVINGIDMPKGNSTKNLLIYSDGRVFTGYKDDINYFAEQLPSADVQPVVRCKDCKHRYEDECPMRHVEWVEYDDDGYIDHDDVVYDYTEDDGYCNQGKRKGVQNDRS